MHLRWWLSFSSSQRGIVSSGFTGFFCMEGVLWDFWCAGGVGLMVGRGGGYYLGEKYNTSGDFSGAQVVDFWLVFGL